ncbi:hypothetical protein KP509_26G066800 [Ceratopteris richardii]|nr:hypothetical protein KP509_26G066800 [Ceratopteris richardii]
MYTKLGEMKKARVVFNELRVQNVVSWTTMMGGYCNHGQGEEALDCFFSMGKKEIYPNAVTFSCALKACGIVRAIRKGSEIHAELARQGFPKDNALVGNALLDMYAKCSVLGMAKQAFVELPVRDIVSWNILIAGYSEHGLYADSLKCFGQMKHKGYSPDAVTYASILKACGNIGAANQGTLIHSEISENRILRDNIILGNALVDLYAKCGDLTEAQIVFNDLKVQDVVSWTSLIAGYCEHGHDEEALVCFEEMKQRGPLPNAITFVCILKACSNIGVLERGEKYFESMTTTYGIVPNSEHHTSLVMLYSHAGCFDKAMAVAKKMPSTDRLPAYFAILHACQKWGNVQIGRLAFEHAFALDKASAVPYIFMNSLHISADIQYADNMEVLQLMNNDSLI